MSTALWRRCLDQLEQELPEQHMNLWIRPLQVNVAGDELQLLAPNQFVRDQVACEYLPRITEIVSGLSACGAPRLTLSVGGDASVLDAVARAPQGLTHPARGNAINPSFTFESFVSGKSNQLARAAAVQVAEHPGSGYNPLFIYGGVGLGKTHLMLAVGNRIRELHPHQRIVYLYAERFVADMVRALQHNTIEQFKQYYRSADALLIDDIQFFAGKERSQEEFFHTFNALLENRQQVILTCDRFPKDVPGLEERLKSRFGAGLTVAIEPPELETRVAILISKAGQSHVALPHDVAFYIAKRVRSNIRELEGALRRVVAAARFTATPLTIDLVKDSLRDLFSTQDQMVSLENIQRVVAEYFKIRLHDLLSVKRSRAIARPRQLAMSLAKELTNHSLLEIGTAFGGRDHTTVLHACRKIASLREAESSLREDYNNLLRTLGG